MSVFTAATPGVTLPVTTGRHEPTDTVHWAIVLDMGEAEPWIVPCEQCTVVEGESSHQAGCDACRGRGWFSTATGLPVKVWWWQSDLAASANWLLHTFTPELLRLAGHGAHADQVDALPTLTETQLGKRLTGVGLLERITTELETERRDLWNRHPGTTPEGHDGSGDPVWAIASDARWEFGRSRLGWWAYRAACAARDLIQLAGIRDTRPEYPLPLEDTFSNLREQYEASTGGLIMLEEDIILGPERPTLHGAGGAQCESRFEHDGTLYRCEVTVPPRSDPHHIAAGPYGPVHWSDEQNVDVRCTATLTSTFAGDSTPVQVQCEDTLYRHEWIGRGVPAHHWYSPEPIDPDGFPDFRSWTDTDDGATAAATD
jgi:hypothetical protein